ncbi:MAG: DUF1592 domain-containing protein [Myxococcota bacterium]|nr:DUF1592 domain-containing protein [Myxococcota bacterium]
MSARGSVLAAVVMLGASALVACEEPSVDAIDAGVDAGGPPGPMFGAGGAPLRTLTRTEYQHAIRDLLELDAHAEERLSEDPVVLAFDNNARAKNVGAREASAYLRAAEEISAEWTLELASHLPCYPASADQACGETFIDDVAPRAYRRALEPAERELLTSFFADILASDDFETAVRLTLQVILQSPQFLHRLEWGDAPSSEGFVHLTPHEIATRLAFLLWSSAPDDALLAAAADGSLETPDGIEAQARRLLADARAGDAIAYFHGSWLGIGDLEQLSRDDASWTPALGAAMQRETLLFVAEVLRGDDGTLRELLTADYTVADAELAMLYGASDIPAADEWRRVSLDPTQRAGLLTQASVLTHNAHPGQTSIVHRGLFVLERLLCVRQPPPPAEIDITLPAIDPSLSTRERFARHRDDPGCRGCHQDMDLLGLGFEHYDILGRWRETEGDGVPVDAHGALRLTGQAPAPFYGARELADALAESDDVRSCYVRQWFRFGFGREEVDADAATLAELEQRFDAAELDVRELLVAMTRTEAFRTRPTIEESP